MRDRPLALELAFGRRLDKKVSCVSRRTSVITGRRPTTYHSERGCPPLPFITLLCGDPSMGHTGTGPVGSSNAGGSFDPFALDVFLRIQAAIAFLRDDSTAMSYQSMGQYRSALLRMLGGVENADTTCDMATGPCACGAWHGDETDGMPIGWTIVATGDDGSVLCRAPNGQRARFWFQGKSA